MTHIIISLLLCVTSACLLMYGLHKYSKAQGIIDSVALIMSRIKIESSILEEHPSNLRKEEKDTPKSSRVVVKGFTQPQEEPQKPVWSSEENQKNATYSGVLHVFKRGGKNRERPVMTYTWLGKEVYFEYAEDGTPIRISGETKKQLLNVLNGQKSRNFKVYELK